MRLFDFNRAPNPLRTRIFIAEKGLSIESINVSLYRMEQLSPEFLQINPLGTLPVLETDDGTYIAETLAICHYLECNHPEPPLFGISAKEQAQVLMWNNVIEQHGMASIAEALRNWSPGFKNRVFPGQMDYAQLPQLIGRGKERTKQFFNIIENQLKKNHYIAGDNFTFADISLLAISEFSTWIEIDPREIHPSISLWYKTVTSRPSFSSLNYATIAAG
ncbi:MAG: glutathione S-transferase family protein [Pseudomonadota bacterium]|nr:glutathione S-transferase family protein [Pseudomonadota bacterium]